MTYENLYNEFKEHFPEAIPFLTAREKELHIEEGEEGSYVLFEDCVYPYFCYLVDTKELETLEKFSDYMEEMELCDDKEVGNLLYISILEQLVSEGKEKFDKFKPYMKKNALADCHTLAPAWV